MLSIKYALEFLQGVINLILTTDLKFFIGIIVVFLLVGLIKNIID